MERIPYQTSCDYFHSRPKSSQIGAVVSRQSTPVPNRDVRTVRTNINAVMWRKCISVDTSVYTVSFLCQYLREKNAELEEKYKDTEVPMPDYWWATHFNLCMEMNYKTLNNGKWGEDVCLFLAGFHNIKAIVCLSESYSLDLLLQTTLKTIQYWNGKKSKQPFGINFNKVLMV